MSGRAAILSQERYCKAALPDKHGSFSDVKHCLRMEWFTWFLFYCGISFNKDHIFAWHKLLAKYAAVAGHVAFEKHVH